MSARGPKRSTPETTSITIAIVGEGVTPRDVGVRQLAALLEATAAAFESVAADRNVDAPQLSLTKVKHGSAAYELASQDRQARRVFTSFRAAVKRRGKDTSPKTRQSLTRLAAIVSKSGAALRVDPLERGGTESAILLAPPLPEDDANIEEATVVHGRVVGVRIDGRERARVTLRYDDGGSGEFDAESELVQKAAALLGRSVSARVTYERGPTRDFEGLIEQLEERSDANDLMGAIAIARAELENQGIEIDSEVWLAEEAEDD